MFGCIYAKRAQALKIDVLDVVGRRFQDHLILEVVLQTIRIFTVSSIGWSAARISASHKPWLWTEHSQEGAGAHGGGALFKIEGLHDDASLLVPKTVESLNNLLKIECHKIINSGRN